MNGCRIRTDGDIDGEADSVAIDARFVIDGTGSAAAVARSLGARRIRFDRLCAVSMVLDQDCRNQALLIEAVSYGWWYLSPLPPGRALVCLVSDADIVAGLHAATPQAWLELLSGTDSVSKRPQPPPGLTRLKVSPCNTAILDNIADTDWLAAGDAASVVDPLSAMGVAKALRSGREAARAARAALQGDQSVLQEYVSRRVMEFGAYLRQRSRHYALESRWPKERFWVRRCERRHDLTVAIDRTSA